MFSYPSGGGGGGGPGIFHWGGRRGQTMVQKGLLNFRTDHRRVPQKTNNIFEYPFSLNSASFMNTCGVD